MKLYRALHTYSKVKGHPCYLPKSSGVITEDKEKAKVWKTWAGIHNFMESRGKSAGYEIESFEDSETREWKLRNIRAMAESMGVDQTGIDIADICSAELGE